MIVKLEKYLVFNKYKYSQTKKQEIRYSVYVIHVLYVSKEIINCFVYLFFLKFIVLHIF